MNRRPFADRTCAVSSEENEARRKFLGPALEERVVGGSTSEMFAAGLKTTGTLPEGSGTVKAVSLWGGAWLYTAKLWLSFGRTGR